MLPNTSNGASWSYPIDNATFSFDFLSTGYDFFVSAASCTGTGSSELCIAPGVYQATNSNQYPLLAKSNNGGITGLMLSTAPLLLLIIQIRENFILQAAQAQAAQRFVLPEAITRLSAARFSLCLF